MFKVNYTGVSEAGDFSPAPEGTYQLKIASVKEGFTQNRDPKVDVTLEIASGIYKGKKVFHTVSFFPAGAPGAGFSKHWLHMIGQPYEGEVTVMPSKWVGVRIEADMTIESYEGKDKTMKRKNVLKGIRPVQELNAEQAADQEAQREVPF